MIPPGYFPVGLILQPHSSTSDRQLAFVMIVKKEKKEVD